MGKTIALYDTKDGLSKSVLAVNIALALAKQSKEKVALIDLSFRGENHLSFLLEQKIGKTVIEILPQIAKFDANLIKGYLSAHPAGITIVYGADYKNKPLVTPEAIMPFLHTISSAFSYTIVITPQETDSRLASILDASDILLVTIAPHLISINETILLHHLLKEWHFASMIIKPIMFTPLKNELDKKHVEEHLGLSVFAEIQNDQENIAASIQEEKPVLLSKPNSRFAQDIFSLTKLIGDQTSYAGITKREPSLSIQNEESADYTVTPNAPAANDHTHIKIKIHKELLSQLDLKILLDKKNPEQLREKTKTIIEDLLSREPVTLTRDERALFVEELLNEVLGLGCLEEFLKDPEITEIMVNGPHDIFVEKRGKIQYTGARFTSATQLRIVIDRIVSPLGRRVDESSPLVDARLSDGSRVNVIIPPLSLIGPTITIRKFSKKKLTTDDLITFGALAKPMADFLNTCVKLRKNIVISGGTGSGKTTLLNVIAGFIPEDERIVTIEDSAELKLPQKHVVSLESRPPSLEGTGEISIRRLVINSLRMRPDRIVVGECRGGETLDMLQAMNTGHDGSLTTIHANSPKDGISRIATMAIMSGTELPDKAIKEQIGSAVQIIVQLNRMSDGSRKITEIAEITGIRDSEIQIHSLFKYEQMNIKNGIVEGRFTATGNKPTFLNEVATHGLSLDAAIFNKGPLS